MGTGTEMLSITPHETIEKLFPEFRKQTLSKRVEKGIQSKVIYSSSYEIPASQNKVQLRDAIWFKPDELGIEGTLTVYTDWGVKFFNYSDGDLFGVLIQSPDLARSLEQVFNLAWEGAKARKGLSVRKEKGPAFAGPMSYL